MDSKLLEMPFADVALGPITNREIYRRTSCRILSFVSAHAKKDPTHPHFANTSMTC